MRSSREDGEGGKRREEATEESKGCRDKKRERGGEGQTSRIKCFKNPADIRPGLT